MKRRIVDFHAHAFPDKIAEKVGAQLQEYYKIPVAAKGYFSELLQYAGEADVEKLVIFSTATKPAQVENVNNHIKGLVDEYPEQVIGFGSIHPDYTDCIKELRRIHTMGLRGIKLHADFQQFAYDEPKMFPIYEELVRLGLPILFHLGDRKYDLSSPRRLARVLDNFPEMTAIGAHLGGVFRWEESMEYLVGRQLYFDTSSALSLLEPEQAMKIILAHGTDKILFGTDYPLATHNTEIERLLKLPLTQEQINQILYQNAYRLLGMPDK